MDAEAIRAKIARDRQRILEDSRRIKEEVRKRMEASRARLHPLTPPNTVPRTQYIQYYPTSTTATTPTRMLPPITRPATSIQPQPTAKPPVGANLPVRPQRPPVTSSKPILTSTPNPTWAPSSATADYATKYKTKLNLDALPYSPPKQTGIDWNQVLQSGIYGGIVGGCAGLLVYTVFYLLKAAGQPTPPNSQKWATYAALAITVPLVITHTARKPSPTTTTEQTAAKEYWSPISRCEIAIPGPIRKDKLEQFGTKQDVISYEEKDGAFMLSYGPMPKPIIPAQLRGIPTQYMQPDTNYLLDSSAKGAVAGMKGTMLSMTPVEQNGYAGRSVEASIPERNGKARARIFFAHDKIYMVLIVGVPEFAYSPKADAFNKSFNILD